MKPENIKTNFFTENSRFGWIFIAAAAVLFICLGGRELWTQETRWADISWYMMYSKDYFHPYLAGNPYYDKPLLSYWLMILFSRMVGGLNEWALRLPAAIAGLIAVYYIYQLGKKLVNRRVGIIAGWMLVSCYFFIFWGRTANADMLNLAGTLMAIVWYFKHRDKTSFFSYTIFLSILAVTALFKGLIGIAIPMLAIMPDIIKQRGWNKHLNFSFLFAVIPAGLVYLLPFWLSDHIGNQHYGESGLYEVYKENVLRYFEPFDHQGPIYTYFIYLPIYMLPWTLFFIPALFALKNRWQAMTDDQRWMVWTTLIIFVFLTLSGSRRSYYVLPIVPFAILMTADWIAAAGENSKRSRYAGYTLLGGYLVAFFSFAIIQPLYYSGGGMRPFAKTLQHQASIVRPWEDWNVVFLDARSKLTLYLDLPKPATLLGPLEDIGSKKHVEISNQQLLKAWPILQHLPPNTIFVTRQMYLIQLLPYFTNYKIVYCYPSLGERVLHTNDPANPVAFVPEG